MVDVSKIVLNGNSTKRALLFALSASDTAHCASLHSSRTLILIYARYKYSTVLRTLLSELDNAAWTSLYAGSARCTLIVVDLRDTCLGINADGTKLACCNTVATAQTAVAAKRLTSTTSVHGSTTSRPPYP